MGQSVIIYYPGCTRISNVNQPADAAKKKSDGRSTRDADKFRLYAEAMGRCCFDRCDRCLVITEGETSNSAQLCHIRGREPEAARHDPYFVAGIDGYENLIVMCYEHHHLIDDAVTRDQYSVQRLEQMKAVRIADWNDVMRQASVLGRRFELIDEICDRLLRDSKPVFDLDRGHIDISHKVHVNHLSVRTQIIITMGLLLRSQVTEAIAGLASVDARSPSSLKNKIRSLYFDLLGENLDGDAIVMAMMGIISDHNRRSASEGDYWPAAAAVVAYFFEACDILERA